MSKIGQILSAYTGEADWDRLQEDLAADLCAHVGHMIHEGICNQTYISVIDFTKNTCFCKGHE